MDRLMILGAALLAGAVISNWLLSQLIAAVLVLLAVPILVGAGLLALTAAIERRQEPDQ